MDVVLAITDSRPDHNRIRLDQINMQIELRPARQSDFDYCSNVYFASMRKFINELNLDHTAHVASFQRQWHVAEVQIITLSGADIGWLQSTLRGGNLFVEQLFVEAPFQRRGIGTAVINRLIDEANTVRRAITLGVVKMNPALRLYERLGFRVTHEDDRKFYMRRDPDLASPHSN